MKVKINISTIWNVVAEDEAIARQAVKEQPMDIAHDYMEDAQAGSKDMERPVVKWEEIR